MSELIEKARNRLKEIELEAERLRVFLAVAGELSAENGDAGSSIENDTASSGDDPTSATPAEIVEAVRKLIGEKGRPLTRGTLVKLLNKQGLKLPGVDPVKNLGTVIWRSKQFDNLAGHGYWPKELGAWVGQRQRQLDVG